MKLLQKSVVCEYRLQRRDSRNRCPEVTWSELITLTGSKSTSSKVGCTEVGGAEFIFRLSCDSPVKDATPETSNHSWFPSEEGNLTRSSCLAFIVNQTQPPSPGPLLGIVSIRLAYRQVCVKVSRRTQSTLGGTILRPLVLDSISKLAKHESVNKVERQPEKTVPPWILLPLSSCIRFCPGFSWG